MLYRVVWEIGVEARNPKEATYKARALLHLTNPRLIETMSIAEVYVGPEQRLTNKKG